MEELIKLLDSDLEYIEHEVIDGTFYITVRSVREAPAWPFCRYESCSVHSYYEREFNDLPL